MKHRPRFAPLWICLLAVLAASAAFAKDPDYRYRNPVIFQRAHLDPQTGKEVLAGKLWVMEEDGSQLRQLTSGTGYNEHPSLYADQEHVLYSEFPLNGYDKSAGARLIKLNIYTGKREVVLEEEGCAFHHAGLSPMDDRPAYHRDCGKYRSQWVGLPGDGYEVTMEATNGVALPDSIIFMHEKNRGVQPRGVSSGAKAQVLTDEKVLHRRPAVSPDGRLLAWQTAAVGEDEIFLANIDGSSARNITNAKGNDGHPWFSRDGKWIVFESDRSGQWEIWRINLASGKQEQLTDGGTQYVSTRPRM